ncbi:Rossmann-fold NAD(P)-binding domain-containing protein [Acuticoccus sediminis]|uniref:hypothetical protein n=1 Tax=Acuticoccus sediminis TaxID=2184697 RepID=UPI001CFE450C|nr:hypothetical protein [Acuticoccus sediminis]
MTMMTSLPKVTDVSQAILWGLPSVAVLGLGRVGTVAAACLAGAGHRVHAVDPDPARVTTLNAGRSPVDEAGLYPLIEGSLRGNRLVASTSVADAVANSDLSLISLDLDASPDGTPDLEPLMALADAIGLGLRLRDEYHVVVMRTCVPPGTTLKMLIPRIEAVSGLSLGTDFGAAFVPAFQRPGFGVVDFNAPPKTVIGAIDSRSRNLVMRVFALAERTPTLTSIAVAEMIKHVEVVWHIPGTDDADHWMIMDGPVAADRLPERAGPGILPVLHPPEVDVTTAGYRRVQVADEDLPLLAAALAANQELEALRVAQLAMAWRPRRVGILGLPLNLGATACDSPVLTLIAELREAGVDVAVHTGDGGAIVPYAALATTLHHRSTAQRTLAFTLPRMVRPTAEEVVDASDVIVIAADCDAFRFAAAQEFEKPVIEALSLDVTGPSVPTALSRAAA